MSETVQTCSSCGGEIPHDASVCPWCGATLGTPPPPKKKSRAPLWARLGCLGVLVLACLIAAIFLPSSLGAPKRSRQKSQIAQVRSFAVMVLSYETDFKKAPIPPGAPPGGGWRFVSIAELKPVLCPDYASQFPETDVFGHPYLYGYSGEDAEAFCVIATGSDGQRDSDALPKVPVKTECYENDVIWMNDGFLQVPEGPQAKCHESWFFWK